MNDEEKKECLSFIVHRSAFILSLRCCHLLGLLQDLFDSAHEVEGLFWNVVVFAVNDFAEAAHGVFELDVLASETCELFGDKEGLREEALNFARTRDDELVFV